MLLSEILPRHPAVDFELINQVLGKKQISDLIDYVYRFCGQKETVIFCDRLMSLGLPAGVQGRHLVRQGRSDHPRGQAPARRRGAGEGQGVRAAVPGRADHPAREVQQGSRRLDRVLGQGRRGDDEGHPPGQTRRADQLGVDDVGFRRARLGGADQAAGRDARADDQALGRDHRDPDHLELQGGADRPRILQLDARRPQGSRRHGAEDRQFGLSDPPPRRCRAGRDHHRGGLRHDPRPVDPRRRRGRQRHRAAGRPHSRALRRGRRARSAVGRGRAAGRRADRRGRGRHDRAGRHRRGVDPLGADLRVAGRRVRQVLWARSGARHRRQYGRGGRRHRGAVDRRARHAADDAHLPYRRRGAARRRAVLDRGGVRRQGRDQEPQRRHQLGRPAGRDGPQHRDAAARRGRPREGAPPRAVRRPAADR